MVMQKHRYIEMAIFNNNNDLLNKLRELYMIIRHMSGLLEIARMRDNITLHTHRCS